MDQFSTFDAAFAYRQDISPTNPPVRIGILAKRGCVLCLQKWTATADYLTAQLPGYSFEIVPLDFSEIKAAVDSREVEFFVVNSSFYVDLERRSGAMRIATLKNLHLNGTVHKVFSGTIICRADRSDIRGINDLKKKSFMAVDEHSLGGWHMAWREFLEEGIDPYRDFSELRLVTTTSNRTAQVKEKGYQSFVKGSIL